MAHGSENFAVVEFFFRFAEIAVVDTVTDLIIAELCADLPILKPILTSFSVWRWRKATYYRDLKASVYE